MSCKICLFAEPNKMHFCVPCASALKQKILDLNKDGKFDFQAFKVTLMESNLGHIIENLPAPIQMDGYVLDASALIPSTILYILNQDLENEPNVHVSSMPSLEKIE